MSLIDSLSWRYAAKRMTGNKVSTEKIDSLLEAIRLSASGFGLQPYKILVIENPELKIYFTKKSNKATLFVSDNGVGIDEEAWKNNDGYGKELVQTFTEQLSGTLTLIVNNGTAFQIEFPC